MRIVLRMFVAIMAFLAGIGAVFAVEAASERLAFDEVAVIEEETYDVDRSVAEYILSTQIDFHLKGIRLGSTENEVFRAFGKPRRIELWSPDLPDLFVYHYEGLDVRIDVFNGAKTVDSIEILSPSHKFEGLTVGSSLEEVLHRFGPGYDLGEGAIYYNSLFPESYISFQHDGAKVTAITHAYDGC